MFRLVRSKPDAPLATDACALPFYVPARSKSVVDELRPEWNREFKKKATVPYCVSLAWSADGSILYSGYTDGQVGVYVCLAGSK